MLISPLPVLLQCQSTLLPSQMQGMPHLLTVMEIFRLFMNCNKCPCFIHSRHEPRKCYNCGRYGDNAAACLGKKRCKTLRHPHGMPLISLVPCSSSKIGCSLPALSFLCGFLLCLAACLTSFFCLATCLASLLCLVTCLYLLGSSYCFVLCHSILFGFVPCSHAFMVGASLICLVAGCTRWTLELRD